MLKNLFICCKNKEEGKKVLEVLEQHGNKWACGDRATNYNPWECEIMVRALIVNCKGVVYWSISSSDKDKDKEELTASEFLEKYGNDKKECIVIYRKGSETIALDKTTGKKAVAKCSPEDEYDFKTGAKLAFSRLIGEKEEKKPEPLYNGKVVCVDLCGLNKNIYTVGKVYQFKNGTLTADNGENIPPIDIQMHNFEEWAEWTSSKFVEIVE